MRKPFDRQRGLDQPAVGEVALDLDSRHELANNHRALREIMGLGPWDDRTFTRSTIHQNLGKLRTETLAEISHQVVTEGHRLAPQAAEAVRGDGFVTETNIHYPTDASLVVDGLRVMLRLVARLSKLTGVTGWRQHKYLLKRARKVLRKIGRAAKRRKDKAQALEALYRELLPHARSIEDRVLDTLAAVQAARDPLDPLTTIEVDVIIEDLMDFAAKTAYVCELAERRVLRGETIPNAQKVFSLFEPHTELINRGKSPNPIELGRRVVVVEDRVGFIVEFRSARRRHAGIESAIHALMAGNGLDRCRDRGEHGYERYVVLAVLGRNLHTLGRPVLGKRRRQRQAA